MIYSIERLAIVCIAVTTNVQGNNQTNKLEYFCRDTGGTLIKTLVKDKEEMYNESRVTKDCSTYLKGRELMG